MENPSTKEDENNQDILEFEDNLERMSRDLVTDILTQARSTIVYELYNADQDVLPSQDLPSTPSRLSVTAPSSPKYVNENDKNSEKCANSIQTSALNQESVVNEELHPSNMYEEQTNKRLNELSIQKIPTENTLSNQCEKKIDFCSNVLNDFRGNGVGSATPDTPRQKDYHWKLNTVASPVNSTIFTSSLDCSQKPVCLREMSPSPPSLSCNLIKEDSVGLSVPTNSKYISEFSTSYRMLTYRQDSPTVINTHDIEQKLKPFSSPLPIYIPSTACTRILKHPEIHELANNYDSRINKFRDGASIAEKLLHGDNMSPESEKLSTEYDDNSYMTDKIQITKPYVPRLQLSSSPRTNHSRTYQSTLSRNSITTKTQNTNLQIPRSTSSSLCWWEPLNHHASYVHGTNDSVYSDKFNLPEPNPEVLKHYHYLCAQQPIKEASLIKAISEAEIKAKYDKLTHYEFLRRRSLRNNNDSNNNNNNNRSHHHKQTRFLDFNQSKRLNIDSKHLNKLNINHNTTNSLNRNRSGKFVHLLQKENKPKKFQYSNDDNLYSIVNKPKKQLRILSSRNHNSQPRKVSSRSNSRIENSLKVKNKNHDITEYKRNNNINLNIHFDNLHEQRLHHSNNQRIPINQLPIENKINTLRDHGYNRSIHSPVSYFIDFNDKSNYNSYNTNQSEYCHTNKRNTDSPTYNNPPYSNNLPKHFYSTELQTKDNSRENELYTRNIHSRRNNLRTVHSKSPCHRNSNLSSGSLEKLRRRCHSIERELDSYERKQSGQYLSSPSSRDPRVDALTSANRILRQRLHDIQKLQENREHALNKAHATVNGLLNKQQKQASIIRESTRNFAQSSPTLLTNNHDYHNTDSYTSNFYKPMIADDSFNLPCYTPTIYGHYTPYHHHHHDHGHHHHHSHQRQHHRHHCHHHDTTYDNSYYDREYNKPSSYNEYLSPRKSFDSRSTSTNLLLEKLRLDYADLANSVCRVEEKARDAASSVQSLLRQFQLGLGESHTSNLRNSIQTNNVYESFNKEPHSSELYDKSVTLRLQKARDTLDQLKSDSSRLSNDQYMKSYYTVPLTISITTTTNSLMTSSRPSIATTTSGLAPFKMNHYSLHEPYGKYSDVYNRPYTNSLRSSWHIS
ncbi:hypothetical protein MN116_004657 [Schistosoma mekongi]|uniref:Uncharacterized protein n=1 Tax=Schistosoma mekongi TaxID=38744 RepID=A0AAE1ZCI8_SCHME|nr:hypothetical protein MN116_004657 [Schistosoma mekongi]